MSSDEVIEPTEIIIDHVEDEHVDYSHVNPWNRFLSRMLDYSLLSIVFDFILSFFHSYLPHIFLSRFIPLEFLLWVPIEALLLSTWGYTPGKFWFKTILYKKIHQKLDFQSALRRSFSVWFRGIGLGIPIINIFALFFSFSRLKTQGITSWDRDEHITITHHPVKRIRILICLIIIIICNFISFV